MDMGLLSNQIEGRLSCLEHEPNQALDPNQAYSNGSSLDHQGSSIDSQKSSLDLKESRPNLNRSSKT